MHPERRRSPNDFRRPIPEDALARSATADGPSRGSRRPTARSSRPATTSFVGCTRPGTRPIICASGTGVADAVLRRPRGQGHDRRHPAEYGGDLPTIWRRSSACWRFKPARCCPAHGPVIDDPTGAARLHRASPRARGADLSALSRRARTPDAIVARIYRGLRTALVPMARESVLAHLLKLEREGRAVAAAEARGISLSHEPGRRFHQRQPRPLRRRAQGLPRDSPASARCRSTPPTCAAAPSGRRRDARGSAWRTCGSRRRRASGRLRRVARRAGRADDSVLRPLRRAAGRSAEPLDVAAVRGDGARRRDLRARARPTTRARCSCTSRRSRRT